MCARTQSCLLHLLTRILFAGGQLNLDDKHAPSWSNVQRGLAWEQALAQGIRSQRKWGVQVHTGFFLYCTSHWATFYEGYKTDMCEIAPVSTTIAESTQCQPRRATDAAPWRTPPSSSLFDIHLTDWSPPTSTRCPFESRSFTCLSVVFVFAWLWVRLAFVLSCSNSKYDMIEWRLGFCDSKPFQGCRHDKGAELAEAPRRKERDPGSGGKKFQGGRGAGHDSDNLTLCSLWSSPQETFAGAHLFRVCRLCCKRDNRAWKSKRLEGDELLIQNKALSKK